MKKRLLHYLESLNYFSVDQFGFQKNKSTADDLLNFTSAIYEGLNDGKKQPAYL